MTAPFLALTGINIAKNVSDTLVEVNKSTNIDHVIGLILKLLPKIITDLALSGIVLFLGWKMYSAKTKKEEIFWGRIKAIVLIGLMIFQIVALVGSLTTHLYVSKQ